MRNRPEYGCRCKEKRKLDLYKETKKPRRLPRDISAVTEWLGTLELECSIDKSFKHVPHTGKTEYDQAVNKINSQNSDKPYSQIRLHEFCVSRGTPIEFRPHGPQLLGGRGWGAWQRTVHSPFTPSPSSPVGSVRALLSTPSLYSQLDRHSVVYYLSLSHFFLLLTPKGSRQLLTHP